MSIKDIINEALSLKPQERYIVIESLVKSLNQPDSKIDKQWIEESTKRAEAILEGNLKTVPYKEVFI